MSSVTQRATIDDLYRVDGKAELIDGRIVHMSPTGARPSEVASNSYVSLRAHVKKTGQGRAYNDNVGYAVSALESGRESFSPDTSCFAGDLPDNSMRFLEGPPTFAVEVRSENGYGPAVEAEMAAKRADYFEAGTLVVWDVDPVNEIILSYHTNEPDRPVRYQRGETADAGNALSGWSISVDEVFDE